jgi:hypothetical protein
MFVNIFVFHFGEPSFSLCFVNWVSEEYKTHKHIYFM